MIHIKSIGPDAEVLGGAINGFLDAINRNSILPHIEKLGMTDLDPNKWYPKQLYVDLWNSILTDENSMMNLVSVGMTIAQTAWPPELDGQPFETLVMQWGDAFDMVNRGADRGYIQVEQRSPMQYAVICCTPDPDDLQYGVVYGFCKRFLPQGKPFTVQYDENVTRRDEGGDETVIVITLK